MTDKYKFEEAIKETMQRPANEDAISAIYVGISSLVNAMEKHHPGFSDSFFESLDYNYDINQGLPAEHAIAVLAAMVKVGLKQEQ